jgi:hypothetical protein
MKIIQKREIIIMISQKEIKRISNRVNQCYSGLVIDGEYNYVYQAIEMPHLEEIVNEAIENLKLIVKSVKRVSPDKSNCIIRAYRHDSLKIDGNTHWIWGVTIYFKTFNGYICEENFEINYEEHTITEYLFQDESVILRPDFVDIYLKIE